MTRNSKPPIIIGAGLAGLLAAHAWPNSRVIEAQPSTSANHRALLRFRGQEVSRLTGIEFRKVRVRKGIWSEGSFWQPSIRLANLYAEKVIGSLGGERSIWNLEAVERFVAPDDLYERLIDFVGPRITWGQAADFTALTGEPGRPVISTAPLPVVMRALDVQGDAGINFMHAPITVVRAHLPGADLYQTVYFPDHGTSLYRASITGSTLIMEFVDSENPHCSENAKSMVRDAFGIRSGELDNEATRQRFGKIAPIPSAIRKQVLFGLTQQHNLYSLGRFATWRNILLDDVVNDIAVIKRLLLSSDYARRVHAS